MRRSCRCPWHFWAHLQPQYHTSRWVRHNFGTSGCFNGHHCISETLQHFIRTVFSIDSSHRVLCVQCATYVCSCHVPHLPSAFCFLLSLDHCFPQQVMDRLSSSASTASSIDDYSEHNVWNPLLELLFLKHVNVGSYLADLDLAKIALSCHFALDLLCYKEEVLVYAQCYIGHHCPWSF